MSGWLLFNIEFPSRKDRDNFEKELKLRRMFQYKWENIYDCTYYPYFESYGEGQEIIKKCKKNKIKIDKLLSMDLSTKGTWFDEIKQEAYEEEE